MMSTKNKYKRRIIEFPFLIHYYNKVCMLNSFQRTNLRIYAEFQNRNIRPLFQGPDSVNCLSNLFQFVKVNKLAFKQYPKMNFQI